MATHDFLFRGVANIYKLTLGDGATVSDAKKALLDQYNKNVELILLNNNFLNDSVVLQDVYHEGNFFSLQINSQKKNSARKQRNKSSTHVQQAAPTLPPQQNTTNQPSWSGNSHVSSQQATSSYPQTSIQPNSPISNYTKINSPSQQTLNYNPPPQTNMTSHIQQNVSQPNISHQSYLNQSNISTHQHSSQVNVSPQQLNTPPIYSQTQQCFQPPMQNSFQPPLQVNTPINRQPQPIFNNQTQPTCSPPIHVNNQSNVEGFRPPAPPEIISTPNPIWKEQQPISPPISPPQNVSLNKNTAFNQSQPNPYSYQNNPKPTLNEPINRSVVNTNAPLPQKNNHNDNIINNNKPNRETMEKTVEFWLSDLNMLDRFLIMNPEFRNNIDIIKRHFGIPNAMQQSPIQNSSPQYDPFDQLIKSSKIKKDQVYLLQPFSKKEKEEIIDLFDDFDLYGLAEVIKVYKQCDKDFDVTYSALASD